MLTLCSVWICTFIWWEQALTCFKLETAQVFVSKRNKSRVNKSLWHCLCVCVCNMSVTPREWTVLMTLWTGNSSSLGFKNINVLSSSIPHEPCGNKEQILHISVPASSYASVWAQWQCTTLRNGISHSILPPQNMSQHSFLFCDEIICFVHTILISLSMQ